MWKNWREGERAWKKKKGKIGMTQTEKGKNKKRGRKVEKRGTAWRWTCHLCRLGNCCFQPGNSSFIFRVFFFVFPALYCDDPGCNITAQLSNICPCKQSAGQLTSSTRYPEFGARQLEPWYLKEAVSGTPVIHLYGGCYEGKEARGPWLSVCSA